MTFAEGDNVPFTFASYRGLVSYLGLSDSLVELNEIAVRAFIASANDSGDPTTFVQEASRRFGINVNSTAFGDLSNRVAQLYVLSVYQAFDQFTYEYRREEEVLAERRWADQGKDDRLEWIFKSVGAALDEADVPRWDRYSVVLDYYRAVRNELMHFTASSAEKAFQRVDAIRYELREEFNTRSAPNAFPGLDVDDFFLFTKVVKALGILLNRAGTPSTERIASLIARKRFRKFRQNHERLERALRTEAVSRFGLQGAEADASIALAFASYGFGPIAQR